MQQTVSISDYALGLQTDTVGKGVQAQSVANSTLANLPLLNGLKSFTRQIAVIYLIWQQFIKKKGSIVCKQEPGLIYQHYEKTYYKQEF